MAITEESRRRLHRELTGVMGEEGATLVVEHLPPMDWTDLATKRDLADTKTEMAAGFALVNERFNSMEARFAAIEARLADHEKLFATKADVLALSVQLEQGLRRMTLTLLYGALGLVGAVTSVVGVLVGT